jgi:fibronectin type 3 domain-containing protein
MAHSVAIDGDFAVVGVPWQEHFRGGARVLVRDGNTWREVQKLLPDDSGAYDHFGASVSIDGDYIRVGAPWQDMLRGAVYVYQRTGDHWLLQEKLAGEGPTRNRRSGPAEASAGRTGTVMSDDALAAIAVVRKTSAVPPVLRSAAAETVEWVSATDAVFEDRVEVKWAPVDLDATLYKVLRDGVLIGVASSDDSLYNDETGARGVTYNYCVVVLDMGDGEGPPTCDSGSRVIRAPERLSASDGQFIDGVHLAWEDRSSVEAGFYVKRDHVRIATLDRNRRSFVDSAALPLVAASYEVTAFDSDGNLSDPDLDDGFRGVVLPPLEVSASDGEFAGSVRVRWVNQGGGVGFVITRRDLSATQPVVLDTTAAGVQEYLDLTAQNGVRYQYCVSALDALGRPSVPACDEGGVDLVAPLNVAASDSTYDDRIQVTWEDASGLADGYIIRRDGAAIDTVASSKRIYNDYHAAPNATHTYCVVAFNANGGASAAGCDAGFRMIVLAATDVRASDGDFEDRAQITWKSSSTTVAVFKILRDGAFIKSVGAGSRSYADDGGTAGREYVYGVQAITSRLEPSATSTDRGRRQLRKPINVAATDDKFEERVEISWRDVSAIETGFVIYRTRVGGAATDSIGETSSGTTSFMDRSGEPGVKYRYGVTAFDVDGLARGESDRSDEDDGVRTLLGPTAVDATDGDFEDRVEIAWKDHSNAEDGYRVYRDSVQIAATGDNVTSIFDLHPPFGMASVYRVRAFDAFGMSSADDDSGSTVLLPPGSLNASDTYADRVELRWVDVSEVEDGYILRSDSAGVALRADTLRAGATSYTDLRALPGVTYTYRLQAFAGPATSAVATDTGERPVPVAAVTNSTPLLRVQANDAGQQSGTYGDSFGESVSINDEYLMLVGAYTDDDKGAFAGAAYVFKLETDGNWSQEVKLFNPGAAADDDFGTAVGISGDWAVAGAPGDDTRAGSVTFFQRRIDGTWLASPKTFANPRIANSYFGAAVDIHDTLAIVGTRTGRAFIFHRRGTTWTQRANLAVATSSVAIDGDWAIVGGGNTVYIYRYNSATGQWGQFTTIADNEPQVGGRFAESVSISDERVIIGRETGKCFEPPGAAYIFEYDRYTNQWLRQARLAPRDSIVCGFGHRVRISGDRALVTTGAPGYGGDIGYEYFPSYLFVRSADGTWVERERFLAGRTFDGQAASVSRGGVVLGSRSEERETGVRSGAVYVSEMRKPENVAASDGTFEGLVHIQWTDLARSEEGFIVYRDGVEYANVGADEEFYDDTQAQPGRTYEYSVATVSKQTGLISERVSDYGWRPPNGHITGRITARTGAGVEGVSVCLEPPPARALLFDGRGGHVRIPDDGTFNFSPTEDFTVEVWFSYSGSDRTPRLISKPAVGGAPQRPLDLGLQRNGRLFFVLSDGTKVARALSRRSDMNDDAWHRVACVHDAGSRQLTLYVDGIEEDRVSTAGLGNLANDQDVFIGGFEDDTWFGGQMDELRIWHTARTAAELDATASAPLSGSEAGLAGYWPFDEFSGQVVTDFAGVPQYGVFAGGVYRTDRAAPLSVCATTGSDGGFVLRNIRYAENGTEYKLRPALGSRQFSPPVQPITLNRDHPVENQLVFSDISSHDVSGAVRFVATSCFEPDVEIWVDRAVGAVSDRNGKFSIALTEGRHTLRAQHRDYTYRVAFAGDTLGADSVTIDVRADVRDLVFLNRTTHPVSGKVGGGCGRYVGEVALRFRSENNCFDTTFVGNPEYTIHLPPMRYFASATIDRETIPGSLVRPDVITFFQNLGEREVNLVAATDSTVIDDRLDFIYRAPLRVTVSGFEPYVNPGCPQLRLEDGTLLPAGLPVIPQGKFANLTIRVDEAYGDSLCPLDTGKVVILDEIFDQENDPDTLTVSGGVATYRTFASTPNLVRGRTEGRTDRSFQKSLVVRTVVEGRSPVTATTWVLVTGHVAPAGAEFVTVPTTELPLFILHDPPGDGSYAYLEEGTTGCVRLDWTRWSLSGAIGPEFDLRAGATQQVWVGVGGGTIEELEFHTQSDGKVLIGAKRSGERTLDMCVTTTRRFATSPEEDFIGGGADLFVGAGLTFLFSEVGVIETNGCTVAQKTAVGFQPDSIYTTYAFTEKHITDVLIPRLNSKVAYFEAQGDADSADVFRTMRDQWQAQVDFNRRDKLARADTVFIPIGPLPGDTLARVEPRPKENRSFSAGTEYEFSREETGQRVWNLETAGYIKAEAKLLMNFGWFKKAEFMIGVAFESEDEVLIPSLSQHTDTTQTGKTGFVLEDDDLGDDFTVDVVRSGKTGYYFDVRGGNSSCPYEPWRDLDSGKVSMVQRDDAKLLISPAERFGIAPDGLATFKVSIANLSDERRDYGVRLQSNSNPGGAVVRLNGSPLTDRRTFSIDGRGSGNVNVHEATLTVERGPSRLNYPDLRLVVEPVCGGDPFIEKPDPFTSDTLSFSVSFEGCSDIHLSGPDVVPGWVYNRADSVAGKQLDLVLSGYELVVDPSTPNLVEAVGIQYRHMGDGREGPGPWKDIREIPPGVVADISIDGSPDTIMVWRPDSLANGAYAPLVDGVYEIRAYTVCSAGGRGYSNVSTGTIDRHAPVVFGTPQPADGELSLGEDIGVTFNEPLDCEALKNATITLKYVDGPWVGQTIPVTLTCNGQTVLLVPRADPAALDGRRLEASLGGVSDLVGNTMTSTVTWQLDYRRSLFTWSETRIVREVALVTPGKVSGRIVNGTDQTVDYEVTSMPGFLSLTPSQARGRLAPGGTRAIEFDIDPQISGGIHQGEVTIHATNAAGADKVAVAILDVVLDVSCAAPVWAIDPSRFEHSMSLVSRVRIAGGTLTGANDRLAAFVGEQLRGVARPRDVAGDTLVFLTVFSNRTSGEMVRFEVWDDDQCRRYRSTAERAPFNADGVLGTTLAPLVLTAQDAPPGSVASFPLQAGWNWFSTNMVSGDMSPGGVLASLAPAAGDIIKSKTAFAMFDPDTAIGWVGTLTSLDNTSGYMIRLTEAGTVLQEGAPADPGATAVPIGNGWNWIGYLPANAMSVGAALADLETRGFLNGDEIVKSQSLFAEWNSGWFGTLETMEPGEAYRLFLHDPALPASFNYPSGAPPAYVATRGDAAREEARAGSEAGWSFDPSRFENNMTLVAHLNGKAPDWNSADDLLGAFVGDECRGVVRLMSVSRLGTCLAFATVHSNRVEGEMIRFLAFHAASKVIYEVGETVPFRADLAAGTLREPIPLSIGRARGDLPTAFRLAPSRPNPFKQTTTIHFELPMARHVVLKIYNVAGHEVCTVADGDYPAGVHDVRWDAKTSGGDLAPNGVYFYQIKAGTFADVQKVVLVR